jgi:adhesin/invasin
MGGFNAPVTFSGLAPGFVGLYQVNVVVPSGLQPGSQWVQIVTGGLSSNIATVPVTR